MRLYIEGVQSVNEIAKSDTSDKLKGSLRIQKRTRWGKKEGMFRIP